MFCAAPPLVALAAVLGAPVPAWLALFLGGLLLCTVLLGVLWPRAGVFARPLLRGAPDQYLLALTFDDGPDPVVTPKVLDLLDQHGQQATFFVIGARAERHPELVAEIARRGHLVENHSFRHSRLSPFFSAARLRADLQRAQETIARITGRTPRWFRPPIGLISPPIAAAARQVGLHLCAWTHRAGDGVSWTSAETAYARLERGLLPGAILVLHDAAERDSHPPVAPEVLKRLLPILAARGLRSVTLDTLIYRSSDHGYHGSSAV